jgi:hypothetical protein
MTRVVSIALLLTSLASTTVLGAVTIAVLVIVPLAEALTVALTVNVTLPPTGRLTPMLMSPTPFGAPHVPPFIPTQVQVTPVRLAGNVSITVAPVTGFGPLLVATIW